MSRVLDLEDYPEAPDLPDKDEWGEWLGFHILDENKIPQPIAIENVTDSSIYTDDRIIGKDMIGEIRVSTVFLNMDHGHGGRPQWFETMIFGGEYDNWMWRYETYKQAKAGHKLVVKGVKKGIDMHEFDPDSEE